MMIFHEMQFTIMQRLEAFLAHSNEPIRSFSHVTTRDVIIIFMGLQDEASEKWFFIGCFPKKGAFEKISLKAEGVVL